MRRLQIKFPNQIRISGWDFGSSARAMNQAGGKDLLMTYEAVSFTQADRAKYARLTFERKIMSTKTSIKRIALVAVASLGLSLVGNTANADTPVTIPKPNAATATSAIRLIVVFVDIYFLSVVDIRTVRLSAWVEITPPA